MKLGSRYSKSELQSGLYLLIFLLYLKCGYLQAKGIECDWSVQRLSCPPYATTDWDCLKTQFNCTNGGEYHCLRDESGEWTETCAKPITCSKGQEPVLKNSQIVCINCKNPKRYEPVDGTESYKYNECRRIKTTCPRDVSYECLVDEADRHAQNRQCRCDHEKDYMPQNYDLDSDVWECKEPDDLNCIHAPCPEDVYGNAQTRGPDYRCVRLSPPVTATPSKKPTERTSPHIVTQTSTRPDMPEEQTEGSPDLIIGVTLGIIAAIICLVLSLAVCWRKNRNQLGAPVSLEAKDMSYFELHLSWQPPQKGYLPAHYILEQREARSLIWVRIDTIPADKETEYDVKGLKAGTLYSFRVISKFVKGKSKPCETESPVLTKAIEKPGMPQGLSGCFDESQKCVVLRWDEIADDGGSEILKITVEYVQCLDDSPSDEKWVFFDSIAKTLNTWTTSNLTGGMVYRFRICASNAVGTSEPAITEKIKYLGVPGKPLDLYITEVSCTKLTLNWEAPESDGGSIINRYCIRQKQGDNNWQYFHEVFLSKDSKQSKRIGVNLTPLKEYYFGISAQNRIGTGDYKDMEFPIVLLRLRDPPDNPIGPLEVSNIGYTELKLSWQPPDNRGGLRLTGYTIEKRENSWDKVAIISAEKTECLIQRLKAGTFYYFRVKANNSKGSSSGLQTVEPVETLAVTRPSKPCGPLAFTKMTRKSITLTWKPPTHDGGSPVTGYDIYIHNKRDKYGHYWTRNSSSKVKKSGTSEKLECTLGKLDLDGEFQFRVQARNVKDSSEPLESTETYSPKDCICAPSAPASVDIKDVKESSLTVTWKAPEDDGGLKIEKYHVFHRIDECEWQKFAVTNPSKSSCKAEKLSFDVKHYFAVGAENQNGIGDWTEAKSPIVLEKKGPPSPPTGPFEVDHNDATSLRLSWQSPKSDGGYALSSYMIYMKEEGSRDWEKCDQTAEKTLLVTKLKEGKKYLFRVLARNKKGDSEPLETKEYISIQSMVPRPPNGPIQYSDLTQSSVTITWKPPDEESSPVSGYKIEYSPSGDFFWYDAGFVTGTSWTQSTLHKNVGYHFRVVSVNSKGESEPLELGEEIKLREPDKPAKIMVVDIIDYQVKLKWHPPSDNGSTEVDYYHVFIQQKDSNWEEVDCVKSAQTEFVTEVLRPGEYLFGICAENSIGCGDMVESAPRTIIDKKPGVPGIPSGQIEITEVTAESVTLKWSPPEDVGDSPLESYKVYVTHADKDWKKLETIRPPLTFYKAKGLKEGKIYKFSVIAKNQKGKGGRLVSVAVAPSKEGRQAKTQSESPVMEDPSTHKYGPIGTSRPASNQAESQKQLKPDGLARSQSVDSSACTENSGKSGVGAHKSDSNERSKDSADETEKNIESSEDLKKEKEAEDFLLELKSKKSWDDFIKKAATISHVLEDSLHIPPRVVFRLQGKSEYKKGNVDVPQGFTAFESSDNGNSLYNSVSLILFGNENYASRLRLAAAREGFQNRAFYIQQIFKGKDEKNNKIFMKNCLSETSFQEIYQKKQLDSDNLGDFVTQMAVRETAMPESNCNPLQVQFLSSASGFPIKQYFENGTQNFYEDLNSKPVTVLPVRKQGAQKQREGNDWCIHILWVLDKELAPKNKKVINRIIPLIEMKTVEDTPV